MSWWRGVGLYVSSNLLTLRGMFRARPAAFGVSTVGIGLALVMVGLGASEISELLTRFPVPPDTAIGTLAALTLLLGALLGLLTVMVALFERRQIEELERLRELPFGSGTLFLFKVIDQSPTMVLGLFLLFPILRVLCRQAGIGVGGLSLLLVAFALLLLQVLFGLFAMAILVVQLLPSRVVRLRYLIGASLLGATMVGGYAASRITAESLAPSVSLMCPQVSWLVELASGLRAGQRRPVLRGVASMIGAAGLLGVVAWWLYTALFLERFESLLSKLRDSGKGRRLWDRAAGRFAGLMLKEWLQFSRDRAFLVTAGMICLVLLVPAFPVVVFGEPFSRAPVVAYWAGVGLALTNLFGFLALSSIGREGEGLGVLAWLPVPAAHLLAGRVLFYGCLLGVGGSGWSGVMVALCGVPEGWGGLQWAAVASVVSLMFWFGLAWLAVATGAIFAHPEAPNPYRRVTLTGVGVFLSLELLLLASALGLLFCGLLFPGGLAVGGALLALIWGLVGAYLMREARKMLVRRVAGRAP